MRFFTKLNLIFTLMKLDFKKSSKKKNLFWYWFNVLFVIFFFMIGYLIICVFSAMLLFYLLNIEIGGVLFVWGLSLPLYLNRLYLHIIGEAKETIHKNKDEFEKFRDVLDKYEYLLFHE